MTDEFTYDSAAYGLGLLDPDERAAFERHMFGCVACSAATREAEGLRSLLTVLPASSAVGLLADPSPADRSGHSRFRSPQRNVPPKPPPPAADRLVSVPPPGQVTDTAGRQRRGARRLTISGLAAAGIVALGLAAGVLVSGRTGSPGPAAVVAAPQTFAQVGADPVRATATTIARSWGTQVDVRCVYSGPAGLVKGYQLVARDRAGHRQPIASWQAISNVEADVSGTTSLSTAQLAGLEIVRTDSGRTVLRLNL